MITCLRAEEVFFFLDKARGANNDGAVPPLFVFLMLVFCLLVELSDELSELVVSELNSVAAADVRFRFLLLFFGGGRRENIDLNKHVRSGPRSIE